ncbi:MAG: DoxX family protein [Bacteroidaceae bacterium]|nr:DoxX family protein [Bacteroidaceae bacterium]
MKANNSKVLMKVAVNACRLLLAVTFLASGFLKADDPLGTVYKMQDYIASLSIGHIPGLILLVASVALSLTEFSIGISLLFGISRRPTARLTAVFMTAMTLLSIYIYIFNPVEDCGCFGDAIVLSNGMTLVKNIILLSAALIITKYHFLQIEFVSDNSKWLVSTISMLYLPAFAIYCIINLPMFDFRPYKIGTDLKEVYDSYNDGEQMADVKIIYEKDGKTLELNADDDDPDSTWHYVETRRGDIDTQSVKASSLFVTNADGDDITEDIIYNDGYTFLLVIPNLRRADEGCIDLVNEIYEYATDHAYDFYCLTASEDTLSQQYWNEHTGAEYPFYFADERELKTMVRATPGLILLHDGKIIQKWSNHALPDEYTLTDSLENLPIGKITEDSNNKKIGNIIMMFIIPLLLLTIIDRLLTGWKFYRKMKQKTTELNLDGLDKRLNLENFERKISSSFEDDKKEKDNN